MVLLYALITSHFIAGYHCHLVIVMIVIVTIVIKDFPYSVT